MSTIDRGPLLQTLFVSFILMHKKTDVTSAMLSKDLFLHLTETTTKLCLACIYNSHATEIGKKTSQKYDFWWATNFIF